MGWGRAGGWGGSRTGRGGVPVHMYASAGLDLKEHRLHCAGGCACSVGEGRDGVPSAHKCCSGPFGRRRSRRRVASTVAAHDCRQPPGGARSSVRQEASVPALRPPAAAA